MNSPRPTIRLAASTALAGVLALTACSTKASGSGSGGVDASGVKIGAGVSADSITLGVMTDKTGVFKNLGLSVSHGNELWAKDFNAAGGVCGRKIKLESVDHGYKADTAKTIYPQIEPKVLGFVQLLGAPVVAALEQNLSSDKLVAAPGSWSSELLENPYIMVVGTTYDIEQIGGMSYLKEKGLLNDGDTIGHIYIDGEYGVNGLRGSQFYASRHNVTIKDVKITSTDNDLTNVVTGLKGEGVKAILVTTTPAQTASIAAANKALGLNAPMLGNTPSFDPALLKTPAADALDKLHVMVSSAPFSADNPTVKDVAAKYKAAYAEPANFGVPYGYAVGQVWGAVLKKACENKDLTRDGIAAALKQTTSASTGGIVADLDFSQPGTPATRQVYVTQPDATAEGGLKVVKPLFEPAEAADYKAPHQK